MTRIQITPAGAVPVAIDVSKLRNDVLIEVPDARRRRRLTVTSCWAEHDRLVAELQALARPVTVGFGPTGRDHRNDWFFALLERFPVPASITALSKKAFIAAAWDVAGRKVAKARLLGDVYEAARTSIALPIARTPRPLPCSASSSPKHGT